MRTKKAVCNPFHTVPSYLCSYILPGYVLPNDEVAAHGYARICLLPSLTLTAERER